MRVFLDTNILLDVLLNRPTFVADSEDALQAASAESCGADWIVTRNTADCSKEHRSSGHTIGVHPASACRVNRPANH